MPNKRVPVSSIISGLSFFLTAETYFATHITGSAMMAGAIITSTLTTSHINLLITVLFDFTINWIRLNHIAKQTTLDESSLLLSLLALRLKLLLSSFERLPLNTHFAFKTHDFALFFLLYFESNSIDLALSVNLVSTKKRCTLLRIGIFIADFTIKRNSSGYFLGVNFLLFLLFNSQSLPLFFLV